MFVLWGCVIAKPHCWWCWLLAFQWKAIKLKSCDSLQFQFWGIFAYWPLTTDSWPQWQPTPDIDLLKESEIGAWDKFHFIFQDVLDNFCLSPVVTYNVHSSIFLFLFRHWTRGMGLKQGICGINCPNSWAWDCPRTKGQASPSQGHK